MRCRCPFFMYEQALNELEMLREQYDTLSEEFKKVYERNARFQVNHEADRRLWENLLWVLPPACTLAMTFTLVGIQALCNRLGMADDEDDDFTEKKDYLIWIDAKMRSLRCCVSKPTPSLLSPKSLGPLSPVASNGIFPPSPYSSSPPPSLLSSESLSPLSPVASNGIFPPSPFSSCTPPALLLPESLGPLSPVASNGIFPPSPFVSSPRLSTPLQPTEHEYDQVLKELEMLREQHENLQEEFEKVCKRNAEFQGKNEVDRRLWENIIWVLPPACTLEMVFTLWGIQALCNRLGMVDNEDDDFTVKKDYLDWIDAKMRSHRCCMTKSLHSKLSPEGLRPLSSVASNGIFLPTPCVSSPPSSSPSAPLLPPESKTFQSMSP